MRKWLLPGVAVALALVANLNLLANGFVYDDAFIFQSPGLQDPSHIPDLFLHGIFNFMGAAGAATNFYRPISGLLGMLLYNLFGAHAWGYHLASILLHAACTFLVFLIGREIVNED